MEKPRPWYRFFVLFLLVGIFLELLMIVAVLSGDETRHGNIAVVELQGVIDDPQEVVLALKKYAKRKEVKSIILRIDSPGGAVAASQEIHDAVRKFKKEKPIVASLSNVAASGGYYAAAPATKIVSDPGSITGSIGVIAHFLILENLLKKLDLQWEVIKSADKKDLGSIFRPMKPEERKLMQAMTDDVHAQFVEAVAEGRGLSIEQVGKLADGRVFSGRQAQKVGLVDELGSLEHAIEVAAKLGEVEGEPKVIYPQRDRFGWFQRLVQGQIQSPSWRIDYRWQP